MKTLFGLSMDSIMFVLLGVFLLVTAGVAILAVRNRLLFKLALRNIPRRRAQTILIVVGLMLSTVIITSAFGTGDTISYSVRASAVAGLGTVDEAVFHTGGIGGEALVNGMGPISARTAATIEANVAANPKADGSMTALITGAPLQDLTSGQTKAGSLLEAFPATYSRAFGGLTTTSGSSVTLGTLAANEAYLNQKAADSLNAHPGDRVTVVVAGQTLTFTVRAILRNDNLASGGLSTAIQIAPAGVQLLPSIILPLGNVRHARPNVVLVSNLGDATSGADTTSAVTTPLRALLANSREVATATSLLARPAGVAALHTLIGDGAQAGANTKLTHLLALVTHPGQSPELRSLLSDPTVISALKTIKDPTVAGALNNTLASISDYSVVTAKQDGLDRADLYGSIFTSIFIVFGLFSIAAGIMLIFLIFVMLAAERRAEMGMARAIGTKRRHLIQQYLFEGFVYNLGAALVGIVLGVLVGLGMVKIMALLLRSVDFSIQSHIEPRSVAVAFSLGALV
ncbi:MAG TPA: ABC transporter permease, partial [Chloroflexota bacterium]